ncbi:MAG TPA: hypothetical protein VG323_15620, partial [Thermoanaerobaculia bacterium]|nr:hypothetical protein [Thermoanaerobaculia bacterium]
EDNIRIDAELLQDSLAPNSAISITYQVQNLTAQTIGIADKVTDVSYDRDSATVTFSIGAEVPAGKTMPHVVTIASGETRVLSAGGVMHVAVPKSSSPWNVVPRYVQIKVNVLLDVTPFAAQLEQQAKSAAAPALPNDLFDKWINASDAVFLNAIPVRWNARNDNPVDASERTPGGGR